LSGNALDHSVKDIERGKIKRKNKSKGWKAKSSYYIRKRKMDFNYEAPLLSHGFNDLNLVGLNLVPIPNFFRRLYSIVWSSLKRRLSNISVMFEDLIHILIFKQGWTQPQHLTKSFSLLNCAEIYLGGWFGMVGVLISHSGRFSINTGLSFGSQAALTSLTTAASVVICSP
jgi:hypothetical protein